VSDLIYRREKELAEGVARSAVQLTHFVHTVLFSTPSYYQPMLITITRKHILFANPPSVPK
jgi:hypothetical protein